MIVALRALWRGGWVEFHGDYYDVPECQMEPAPTEPVPIIGGGHSPVALRRTAALCDGWKGRHAVGWLILGFFFSLITLIVILLLPSKRTTEEYQNR
jgi:alkanesulfonate monooxygenase SsuD/methylene tetrahydromethanopterin reductase-like flavin-dependent oxidoreductase (luciferase family)